MKDSDVITLGHFNNNFSISVGDCNDITLIKLKTNQGEFMPSTEEGIALAKLIKDNSITQIIIETVKGQ
jgi:hypothetical protein